jgi:N-acyl-D-amino-acid deacylase
MSGFGLSLILTLAITFQKGPADGSLAAQRHADSTGSTNAAFASLDQLMRSFVREKEIPGAALAVAKHGRLIYARGFGLADRDVSEPVQPDSLFRIASISKPITAFAILRLVEQGALHLDDRVFDVLHLDERVKNEAALDPRWRQITLRQLLQHTGGWDRDLSFDPMFRGIEFALRAGANPPANQDQIIQAMLEFPLDFDPGTRFSYSNFGYCLLGRVIEAASGRDYEAFVRSAILSPLGIETMRLGRTRLSERARGEVRYYVRRNPTEPSVFAADVGQSVLKPYGAWNLDAFDAHGGWIASAVDLVRIASALDNYTQPRLLQPETVEVFYERPQGLTDSNEIRKPTPVHYGLGWQVRKIQNGKYNTWHSGSLPGTSTLLVRRHDGYCWAVLFNTRVGPDGRELSTRIDPLLHKAVDSLPDWPDSVFTDPTPGLSALQDRLLDLTFPNHPFAAPGEPALKHGRPTDQHPHPD